MATFSALSSCAYYVGPPDVTLAGDNQGLLADPTAPLVLTFSEAIDPSTLSFQLAADDPNIDILDPGQPEPANPFFTHVPSADGSGDDGGVVTIAPDAMSLTLTLPAPLPAGAKYMFAFDPGLSDTASHPTRIRKFIEFGYNVAVQCDAPTTFATGDYFILVNVAQPIGVQVRLYASMAVDPSTGAFNGQFTEARRNPDPNRCPMPCPSTDACQLLPTPACVAPSQRAQSVDDFPDFVPTPTPPIGFSFYAPGCAVDQGGAISIVNAPVDVQVQQPAVTLRNTRMLVSFTKDSTGVLRGSGTLTADDVLLGNISSGRGAGDLTARQVAANIAPMGIPLPDGGAPTGDAGTD